MNAQTVKLKHCGCGWCRNHGMRTSNARATTKRVARSARREWDRLAKEENDESITSKSVPPSY